MYLYKVDISYIDTSLQYRPGEDGRTTDHYKVVAENPEKALAKLVANQKPIPPKAEIRIVMDGDVIS